MSAMAEVDQAIKDLGWSLDDMRSEDLAEVYAMGEIANSHEYIHDACDHLADKGVEDLGNGRWTWTADGWTVAHLVHHNFDGGAIGFLDLMAEYGR
ncbi:hypothetical protein [Mycobacteroides abscessus]|uniref:hypothetical protein n=1 Tax=Mycobacteroides abscessus TaxID=36809 RepID=UPI0002DA3958|nr:hypothetical protein [Mycobacteroides abscessus]